MSGLVVGSVLLYCGVGTSNKEFLIQVVRNPSAGSDKSRSIKTMHGPAGKLRAGKDYGSYTSSALGNLLKEKAGKGYEITKVNEKPFTSGDHDDALRLIENGNNWNEVKTSQPTPRMKIREVEVTFDVGQLAPIW